MLRMVAMWTIFVIYLAVILFIILRSDSDSGPVLPDIPLADSAFADSSITSRPSVNYGRIITRADSLAQEVENAIFRGDLDDARRYAQILNQDFPGSSQAETANFLIENEEMKRQQGIADNSEEKTAPTPARTPRRPNRKSSQITDLEKRYQESEIRVITALERMRTVKSDKGDITWYYNKNVSHFVYKNSFEAYIGHNNDGDVWLRLRIYYNGDKWLDIHTYDLSARSKGLQEGNTADEDGKKYTLTTLHGKIERGRGRAGAWEWFDMKVSQKEINMMEALVKARVADINYIGESGNWNRTITVGEKQRLQHVLEAYYALSTQREIASELAVLQN